MSLVSQPLLAKLIGSPALLSPFSHPSEPAISLSYQYRDLSSQKPIMTNQRILVQCAHFLNPLTSKYFLWTSYYAENSKDSLISSYSSCTLAGQEQVPMPQSQEEKMKNKTGKNPVCCS